MIGDRIDTTKTKYGAAIGLIKGDEIFLSRRVDTPVFPKKWQFANGRLRGEEDSKDAATRIVEEQTGIYIAKPRLHFLHSIQVTETAEFYYLFLLHLNEGEVPMIQTIYWKHYSDWKSFKLEKAVVLDLVPGIRTPIRKLLITYLRLKSQTDEEIERRAQQTLAF